MSDITNLLSTLSDEQIQDILAVSRQAKEQRLRDERRDSILREEIIVVLENTTSTDLKRNLTIYARNLPRYDGGNWTLSGAVNKELLPAIRQYKLDATQTIEAFYKGDDQLRTAARATIEIFEDLQHLVEQGGNREELEVLLEKQRRLAVYQLPRENNWTTTQEQSPSKQRDSQNPSNTSQKKRTKRKTSSWIPPLSRGSTKPSSKNPYSDGQQTPIIGEISTTEVAVADMDCEEDLTIEATRRIFPGKGKAPGRRRDTTTLRQPTPNSRPINTDIDDDNNEYVIDPTITIPPSTWGPLVKIQRTMEGIDTTSLALFSSFPRLSVTISHEAQPLANQTLTIQCGGTNSSRTAVKTYLKQGVIERSPS